MHKKAYLILENGDIYTGQFFGKEAEVTGELVFTTGMTGYLETLTDPSYYGQIITQTFPLIGNYGIIEEDFESDIVGAKAYIVKHWCQEPSNFRGRSNLDTFFMEKNITGICGIDTRALTKTIRKHGTMNGIITSKKPEIDEEFKVINEIKEYQIVKPVECVSSSKVYVEYMDENDEEYVKPEFRVAMIDYGLKKNIKHELIKRGCILHVFPYNANADEIMSINPDGIMLSNGPGNPEDNIESIEALKILIKSGIPMFGICLGHQLTALAHGFETRKLKFGHRGANQPVKDIEKNRTYITSQNHGYEVVSDSVDQSVARVAWTNVNDGTCEGIRYLNENIFTVQFHPEACGGPKDSAYLFDEFIQMMKERKGR